MPGLSPLRLDSGPPLGRHSLRPDRPDGGEGHGQGPKKAGRGGEGTPFWGEKSCGKSVKSDGKLWKVHEKWWKTGD